jgi:hypothetical protein
MLPQAESPHILATCAVSKPSAGAVAINFALVGGSPAIPPNQRLGVVRHCIASVFAARGIGRSATTVVTRNINLSPRLAHSADAYTPQWYHLRQPTKNGEVKIVYDSLTLPTGETVSVRPVLKSVPVGPKVAKRTGDAAAMAVGVVLTAGVGLLAGAVTKGVEEVVPAGTVAIVYLDGPLSIDRQAAMALQPAPSSGYGFAHTSANIPEPRKHHTVSKLFCDETLIHSSHGVLQLELPAGAYLFSTDNLKDRPVRINVVANHEYDLSRNRHGLLVKERQPGKNIGYLSGFRNVDVTGLTPEAFNAITAEATSKRTN